MAQFFLRQGRSRRNEPRGDGRRGAHGRDRWRSRLKLEILEQRCLLSTVTNLDDAGPGSLREAIASTADGGTVDFQPGLAGTITLTSGELAISKDLTIAGPGANVITVSGDHHVRAFDIRPNSDVAISGLTIVDGFDSLNGGGIANFGTLTLSECTVSGSSASQGGGIYSAGGPLTVSDCTVSGNKVVTGGGGGIENFSGTATITRSTVSGNSSTSASGGIANLGTMTLTDSTVSGNHAFTFTYSFGGGIGNSGTLTVIRSLISDNSVGDPDTGYGQGFGGGVVNGAGTLTLIDSTLSGNSAVGDSRGGGIDNSTGTVSLTNCTLTGNSATMFGGGINNDEGMVTLTGSTLNGNFARTGGDAGGGAIFNFNAGTLIVTTSTLSGNSAMADGGGIVNLGTLTITASTFTNNSAPKGIQGVGGGAIANYGTATLTDSTLSGNSATSVSGGGGGGGIYNGTGTFMISRSTLSDNHVPEGTGDSGGGILNRAALIVNDSTLSANSAGVDGGGIDTINGSLTVDDCTLDGNSAVYGGAVFTNNGAAAFTDSTIRGNHADYGGAVYADTGPLTITSSTLSGNSAVYGGGIESYQASVTVTDSTISGNSAANTGAAIYFYGSALNLASTTVSRNAAGFQGGGIVNLGASTAITKNTILGGNTAPIAPDVDGPLNSQGHNLIGDGSGGSGFVDSDLVGTADNPIDPRLGPLQANGGPTPTMALLLGSPAIDAGDNTDAPATDQRGAPRIFNGTIDIGAYEVQAAPAPQCAVAQSLLWPPNYQLINVGLGVQLNDDADPSTQLHVQVFGNDGARPADAADIGPGTLRLRAERQGSGGRVYLVVALADDASGQSGFDVCAVVVPHDQSAGSIAEVLAEAAEAEAFYRENQTAPPGYALLGEGPAGAGRYGSPSVGVGPTLAFPRALLGVANLVTAFNPSPLPEALPAHTATERVVSGDGMASADAFFRSAREEASGFHRRHSRDKEPADGNTWLPVFSDD
jgi:hypothetical protein